MPPWHRTFTGRDAVARFMTSVWPRYDGFRSLAVVANGQPAAAVYTRRGDAPYLPHSLHVLTGSGQIGEVVFLCPAAGREPVCGLRPAGPRLDAWGVAITAPDLQRSFIERLGHLQ